MTHFLNEFECIIIEMDHFEWDGRGYFLSHFHLLSVPLFSNFKKNYHNYPSALINERCHASIYAHHVRSFTINEIGSVFREDSEPSG